MTLERRYDPKIDQQSTSGCVNDSVLTGKVSYTLALSTASASIGPIGYPSNFARAERLTGLVGAPG